MTLFLYRIRSAPFVTLTAVAAAWLLGSAALFASFRPGMEPAARSAAVLTLLYAGGLGLGLCTAFLISEDVDPPEALLRTAPTRYWHLPLQRLGTWFALSTLSFETYIVLGAGISTHDPAVLRTVVLPNFVFVSALAFLSASVFGSYFGGGAALMSVGLLTLMEVASRRIPLRLRDLPPSPTWPTSRWLLIVASFIAFVVVGWKLRR